ncbi:MAG: hypothetical protein KJ057_06985 [Phycisphaerae bacterium]|nr:MAG: hypothetical protein EDS66_04155 [Planctomycetota bacterium]KAB2943305.1 MAG: hypothetical protein F9K17_12000 [Phycisphaerae bacterium]MBE7456630.1 hypothetical protein [Planctomycetia bacterium]MCK6463990.1 hypothetical protein [Phycisphaerae bacterium]MCL4718205.1 hypothetical protein [Phycisphaerae bacterium]
MPGALAALAMLAWSEAVRGAPRGAPPPLTEDHRAFLSRVARRTLIDAAEGRPRYALGYVPKALESVQAEVVVRFRVRGLLVGQGTSGPAPIATACRDAALAAFKLWRTRAPAAMAAPGEVLIEIEVPGAAEVVAFGADATIGARANAFAPGLDGVIARHGNRRLVVYPTEFFSTNTGTADTLRTLMSQLGLSEADAGKASLERFRSEHWYEASSGGPVVSLRRGMTAVEGDELDRVRLTRAIDALGDHLLGRQQSSGFFSYEYDPVRDAYDSEPEFVRQAGAAAAIAVLAARTDGDAPASAARRTIEEHLKGLRAFPDDAEAAFIATPDGANPLGVTALLALALAEHPSAAEFAAVRGRLIRGMLRLQAPSGLFPTAFPPARSLAAQDYFPGEAFLALAADFTLAPSQAVNDGFDRGIGWYREHFRERPSPAFVIWQGQAYARMAQKTRREDYIAFAFELADWGARGVIEAGPGVDPDLAGGVRGSYEEGAGASTASFLCLFADAAQLARTVGDRGREDRYVALTRSAARFVVQLQIRPEEAYFCPVPGDAVGGVRNSPAINRLRLDVCGHALVGLIKARDVLFGDE